MSLTQAEFDRIDEALTEVIERSGEFGSSEVDFAMSNAERLDKHGLNTRISVAQWDVIARIENRIDVLAGED